MLFRRLLTKAIRLGYATKITFAQGHGYSIEEIQLMEKERQGLVSRLNSKQKNDWFIPNHIFAGQAFSYETELFSFVKRIGCNSSYVSEKTRSEGNEAILSSALSVVLSHPSSCHDLLVLDLKSEICNLGRQQLSAYIMSYFSMVFPNVSSEILYKLSTPETCMTSAKCYSLYKHLCLHELIRNKSENSLTLEEYSDVIGGIFLSILLFDEHPYISAPVFLQSCILNYYAQLDFRNIVTYDNLEEAENKLQEYLLSRGAGKPEVRVISIDGEETPVPLYNIGVFVDGECFASAADNTVENATLMACNAGLTNINFSERNDRVSIYDLDFSTLSRELVAQGKEIGGKLKEGLDGVNIAQLEMESWEVSDHFKFAASYDSYKKLLGLRKLSYENEDKIAEKD